MKRPRIAIVGSGVIGLSVCCELVDNGFSVDLFSPQPIHETTSATAAAYWAPYWVGDYPKQWASETLGVFHQMASQNVPGVRFVEFEEWLTDNGYHELTAELARDDIHAAYWWRDFPGINFRIESLAPNKTLVVPPHGEVIFTRRVCFTTVVARMADYLDHLLARAKASGQVNIRSEWVDDLGALTEQYDFVFNCTGWGAKSLCADDAATAKMKLLAGMVCRVETDALSKGVLLHQSPFHQTPTYVVPRFGERTDVICGGTAIEVTENVNPREPVRAPQPEQWQQIMDRSESVCGSLKEIGSREDLCGLRPVRSSVRVEKDSGDSQIIHCYGHGGSGLTLSWGSARAAIALMKS